MRHEEQHVITLTEEEVKEALRDYLKKQIQYQKQNHNIEFRCGIDPDGVANYNIELADCDNLVITLTFVTGTM